MSDAPRRIRCAIYTSTNTNNPGHYTRAPIREPRPPALQKSERSCWLSVATLSDMWFYMR